MKKGEKKKKGKRKRKKKTGMACCQYCRNCLAFVVANFFFPFLRRNSEVTANLPLR